MKNSRENSTVQLENEADESPRMKCLLAARNAHNLCMATAKTPEEKKACNEALSRAEKACPPPDPGFSS